MASPSRISWMSAALAFLSALAFASALRAQTWQLDSTVNPTLVHETNSLLAATFITAPEGRFLAYGEFTHVNGTAMPGLARFGPDGKLDPTFAPNLATDERILALALLDDGRSMAIISTVAPSGTVIYGTPYDPRMIGKLTRLLADGRKDPAFATLAVMSYGSVKLTPTPDGRVLVWGALTELGARPSANLARLNRDGTIDSAYSPWTGGASISPPPPVIDPGSVAVIPALTPRVVTAVAPTADGSVVVSGVAPTGSFLTRFLPNGSIDSRFAPTTIGATNAPLLALPDGSVLAANANLTRYNSTGALDRSYNTQIPLLKNFFRVEPLSV